MIGRRGLTQSWLAMLGAGGALAGTLAFHTMRLNESLGQNSSPPETPSSTEPASSSSLPPRLSDGRQRAFPTAEGFGAAARGGRGGRVIFVTNVKESGEGSLRSCVEADGPRVCVFRVSGTITLERASLKARKPFLTIAGETAPGGGIAIRNGPRQPRPSLEILTHDVIMRHLRLRPGPHEVPSCCSGALGLYGLNTSDIMIDHVSASWGSDETVDSESATKFTIQWSFITEPLLNGGPGKHNRARNMLLTRGGDISVHHNLFALGKFRSPQFQTSRPGNIVSVTNNVLYSPIWEYAISFSDRWTPVSANVVGNYKMAGKRAKDDRLVHLFEEGGKGFSIFLAGNVDETYRAELAEDASAAMAPPMRGRVVSTPFADEGVRLTTAERAFDDVLANAGATRPMRDGVDARMIETVRDRSGTLLKSDPAAVGGWPELESAAPPVDADGDGMADAWELTVGLNPYSAADGALDLDGDGWTNLEEYLHELAGDGQGMIRIEDQ